jgi:glutamate 5-kinase
MIKGQFSLAHVVNVTKNQTSIMGESMVFYTKKLMKNIKFKTKQFFTKTQEVKFNFYLYFILKPSLLQKWGAIY